MKKVSFLVAILMIIAFAPAANAYVIFDAYADPSGGDYLQWRADCIDCTHYALTENFEDNTLLPGLSVTSDAGIINTGAGIWEDQLRSDSSGNIVQSTTWTYDAGVGDLYGFGGFWNLNAPLGPGSGIDVYADGSFVGTVNALSNGDFWGFTSDVAFNEVLLRTDFGQETYYTVDLHLCTQPVPVPSVILLMGTGLLGFFGVRRRSRR